MAVSKSMRMRIARVKSLARRKKIAELERQVLAEASQLKSLPMSGDDGSGTKAKQTASDKYKRDKNQPKPKGDRSQAKLDMNDSGGYPAKGKSTKCLGKGSPKKDTSKTTQSALDEALADLRDLTSDTPELAATPKPKLGSKKSKPRRRK